MTENDTRNPGIASFTFGQIFKVSKKNFLATWSLLRERESVWLGVSDVEIETEYKHYIDLLIIHKNAT